MTVERARTCALSILTSSRRYTEQPFTTPGLDISVILSHFLKVNRSYLLAHGEAELGETEEVFFDAVHLRSNGLPVAYITGTKEFWRLPFKVTPAVLIPKGDTEILVERAIAIIGLFGQTDLFQTTVRVLDVCTGSGCIAVALKHSCPEIEITATDISQSALEIARQNAQSLLPHPADGTSPIRFIQGDLQNGLPLSDGHSPYHLVVSNPPYVPTKTAIELLKDGRREPLLALDGGTDGLALIRPLVYHARKALVPSGILLLETGEYNAKRTGDYLNTMGFVDIVIHKDLEGQYRVVEGRQP